MSALQRRDANRYKDRKSVNRDDGADTKRCYISTARLVENNKVVYLKHVTLTNMNNDQMNRYTVSQGTMLLPEEREAAAENMRRNAYIQNVRLATEAMIYYNILQNGCEYIVKHNRIFKTGLYQLTIEMPDAGVPVLRVVEEMAARNEPNDAFVLKMMDNVIRALQYCHANGVVHCDLKCGNIVVDPATGAFKLMDFGMSRIQRVPHTLLPHETSVNPDTYQPPEILLGADFDEKVDIFALGCTFCTLIDINQAFPALLSTIPTAKERADFIYTHVCNGRALDYIANPDVRRFTAELVAFDYRCRPCATLCLEKLLLLVGGSNAAPLRPPAF